MTSLEHQVLVLRTRAQKEAIVRYIAQNRARFSELVMLTTSEDPQRSRRAAWPLSDCVLRHPHLVEPHLSVLIDQLEKPCPPAVARNILRLLQQVPIGEADQGRLMDYCFGAVMGRESPAANKASALTILAGFAQHYPEIREEILLCIEARWPDALPSFQSRAKKVIRELNKIPQTHKPATPGS